MRAGICERPSLEFEVGVVREQSRPSARGSRDHGGLADGILLLHTGHGVVFGVSLERLNPPTRAVAGRGLQESGRGAMRAVTRRVMDGRRNPAGETRRCARSSSLRPA